MSERAKSRLNRTASKDSDDASGSPHLTPSKQESGSAHGTPSRQQAGKQQGNGEAQNKSSFFATLDWTDDSGAAPEEGAPPVQRTEAQVSATVRARVSQVMSAIRGLGQVRSCHPLEAWVRSCQPSEAWVRSGHLIH